LALLSASAQTGRPQPAPGTAPPPLSDDKAPVPTVPIPPPDIKLPTVNLTPVPVPALVPPPTVEDLLAQLQKLRQQKAELEKQEQAVVAKLQERLKDQADQLKKLGIVIPAAAPPPPQPEVKDALDTTAPRLKDPDFRDKDKK
jgi:hypothetical protein